MICLYRGNEDQTLRINDHITYLFLKQVRAELGFVVGRCFFVYLFVCCVVALPAHAPDACHVREWSSLGLHDVTGSDTANSMRMHRIALDHSQLGFEIQ